MEIKAQRITSLNKTPQFREAQPDDPSGIYSFFFNNKGICYRQDPNV